VSGREQWSGKGEGKDTEGWRRHTYEDRTMKPTKHCLKKVERETGNENIMEVAEYVHGTLYACMELSQWHPLI
jgi:hypothetical protein